MRFSSVFFILLSATAVAQPPQRQSADPKPLTERVRKQISAERLPNDAIKLDGIPDEAVWAAIPPIGDFLQKQPVEGGRPSDSLEVRLGYDDQALFVAIRVLSKHPESIQAPVSRRDIIGQAEHVWVSFDTFHDGRTAYSFGVTASGVRGDWYHPRDHETDIDPSYDPVWQAVAHRNPQGWTAEMRIPFNQLRFNAAEEQTWGFNVDHWLPNTNEDVFWIPVPTKEVGWSSWMGELHGIRGIKPTRRVEVMPYVAGNSTANANRNRANPFDDGKNIEGRVGGDLKMGLGPGLTLEATINPDFGQVEADPAEVNLSAFETFFSEKRPFFIEGSQLLQGNGAAYFYSRRIGARPRGGATGTFVDYPSSSTILGATKLTGRLPRGTSVGLLTAITDRERARTFLGGQFRDTVVAPRTGYAVGRVAQQFGTGTRAGSTAGVIVTGVARQLSETDPLRFILTRHAYSGGSDFNLRFLNGRYTLSGHGGFSYVAGDSNVIGALQRSSARYFQRPDAESYHYDPSRTLLSGYTGGLTFAKNTGRHWLWSANVGTESPAFEVNDIGRISTGDGRFAEATLRYRETVPGKYLRAYGVSLDQVNEWNYDGDRQFGTIRADADVTFKNFWSLLLTGWHDFRSLDERLTRGGPLMGTGYYNVFIAALTNSGSAKTRWQGRVYYGKDEFGAPVNRLSGLLSTKPAPQWSLSIAPNFLRNVSTRQYLTTRTDGRAATYGKRYIFGRIDQSTFITDVRVNYTFKPDVSVELFAEPFAASGRYNRWGELPAPGARLLRVYGTDGTSLTRNDDGSVTVRDSAVVTAGGRTTFTLPFRDFNVRSFRSNLVLRWEYRPGSTLFLVWQQQRDADVANGDLVSFSGLVDPFFGRVGRFDFGDPGVNNSMRNFFAVKLTYWLGL